MNNNRWLELFRGSSGSLALGLLALQFVSAITTFTLSTILPSVARDLDGYEFYGLATSSTVLATILAVPVSSPVISRLGLRKTVHLITPVFVFGLALAALAPNMFVFIVGQVLRGASGSILSVVSLNAMISSYPAELRSRMIALSSSMWILPAMIGPAYAAIVTDLLNWRYAIGFVLPFIVASRILIARQLSSYPASENKAISRFPVLATCLLVVGATAFFAASGFSDDLRYPLLVAGFLITLAGLKSFIPDGAFAFKRGVPSAVFAMFLLSLVFCGAESLVTLMFTTDLGSTVLFGGIALTFGAVARSVGSLIQPRMVETPRLGLRGTSLAGVFLFLLALIVILVVLVGRFPTESSSVITWAAWALAGLGMGLCYSPLTLASFEPDANGDVTGRAASLTMAETSGALIGMSLGGALIDAPRAASGDTGVTLGAYVVFSVLVAPVLIATARIRHSTS